MNLYRRLLWGRRILIAVIIIAGYGFYVVLERNQALVQLGLISFVAVLQFLPGVFGVLFWSRATRAGVIAGLLGGGAVWGATMLAPLLARSDIIGPQELWSEFAPAPGTDGWSLATFASLGTNACLFFVVSLLSRQSHEETQAAEACRATSFAFPGGVVIGVSTPAHFEEQLARILGPQAASSEVHQALADLGMDPEEQDPGQLRRLRERIERNLSGLLGPMLSRMIVDERLQTDSSARSALADNIRLIEERLEQSRTRLDGVAAELDQLRRYHQQVLRDLPLGACAVDDSRKVTSWNAAMERLAGLARHEVLGNIVDRLPPPWGAVLGDCLNSPEEHLHKRQVRVDGRARWFNLHKAAIAGGRSALEGTVVLLEDLTDLHTLESELAHAERLASIGRLAAGVAHEIGNPVTAIACLAQNLHSETRDREALEASGAIIEQTRRISDIVQSLVSFSHGGSSLSTGTFVTLAVRECVDEAMRLVRLSRAAKAAELRNECDPQVLIDADRPRFVQVLVNLLTNAIDASAPRARVLVSCDMLGEQALVHVRDEGEGIDEEIMAQIFEPFVTTKPPGRGTGLGLSVVYRIVNDHGGNIQIDSVRGRGTVVTVSLPLARSVLPPAAADEASPRADAR
jgi:PAS domain S-box-containing protein